MALTRAPRPHRSRNKVELGTPTFTPYSTDLFRGPSSRFGSRRREEEPVLRPTRLLGAPARAPCVTRIGRGRLLLFGFSVNISKHSQVYIVTCCRSDHPTSWKMILRLRFTEFPKLCARLFKSLRWAQIFSPRIRNRVVRRQRYGQCRDYRAPLSPPMYAIPDRARPAPPWMTLLRDEAMVAVPSRTEASPHSTLLRS